MKNLDFARIFNSFKGHILILSTDLKVLAVSEGVVKMLGIPREEHIGRSVFDHFSSPDPKDFIQSLQKVMATKESDEMDIQNVVVHGEQTYWKPITSPVLNENNEIEYLIHESRNVTDVVTRENELLKNITLRDIIDRQSDGFFVIDKDDRFSFVNHTMREFAKTVNTKAHEGLRVEELFTSDDLKNFMSRYKKIRETKIDDHFTEVYEGRLLSVDAYPTLNDNVAVFFRDITDKNLAQQRLQLITDHLPAFVSYYDTEGRYQFVNKAYEEWFEVKAEDVIGQSRASFAGQAVADEASRYAERALKGEMIRFDITLKKEKEEKHVEVSYIPDFDPVTNTVRGIVTIAYNITDRVNALKLRDDFMSVASHELKTPLTSISLQSFHARKRIQKNGNLGPIENEKFIFNIDDGIRRLNRLIDDMLDISRIDHGKLTLLPEKFDLVKMVDEIKSRYSNMTVDIEVKTSEPLIGKWDKMRIDQVISNIINNSVKYAKGSPIRIFLSKEDNMAVLKIQDDGPEFPSRARRKFFSAMKDTQMIQVSVVLVWVSISVRRFLIVTTDLFRCIQCLVKVQSLR